MANKTYAFVASWRDKRSVTVEVVDNRFQNRSAVDCVVSGSLQSAVRVFNQRHTVLAWGKVKPKYNVILP